MRDDVVNEITDAVAVAALAVAARRKNVSRFEIMLGIHSAWDAILMEQLTNTPQGRDLLDKIVVKERV